MSEEKVDDYGEPISSISKGEDGKPDFRQNHGCCRDLYCLIIFIAAIIAMIVIFAIGFTKGDPRKLIYPLNENGMYCGLSVNRTELKDFPYLFRPNLANNTKEVCVKECPKAEQCFLDNNDGTGSFEDIGIAECGLQGRFPTFLMTDLIYRCIPDPKAVGDAAELVIPGDFQQLNNVLTASVSDFQVAWWVLLVAVVLAIFFSLIWTCLFQCLGGCCIWTSIVGCLVVIFILGIYVLIVGITQLKDSTEADKTNNYVFIGFGALLLLIGVVLVLILIFLRKRINLAIDLIKEAGRVLRNSWCIILIPICYILIFIVATVLFVITVVYFCSSMDVSIEGGQRDLVMNNSQRGILLVSFFIYLWVLFFLVGMNQTTLAGVGASYYFAHSDDERPTFPIARTLKIIFLHHLGSVAVGSCLIAIVAFIRAVVMYLQKQAKKSQNKAAQMCLKCLQCCLGCLQRIVEYITSRGYVMMMIHGKGFFHSAYDGIRLVMRNFIRSSIVGSIAKLVVFFGIFVIMLLTTFVCIVILRPDFLGASEPFLHVVYWWLIVLVCVIISFTVAYLMMSIYDFLVTTIFLCFLQDEEMAQTNGGQYVIYASEDLRSHMEVAKQKGQEMLDKDQQRNAE